METPFKFEKKKLNVALIVAVVFYSLPFLFSCLFPEGNNFPNFQLENFILQILQKGIIYEVIFRLFLISLIIFILHKYFFKNYNDGQSSEKIFMIANIISLLIFIAGHHVKGNHHFLAHVLFLYYQGGQCLLSGWLFYRYGIQYAIINHVTVTIINNLFWLFLSNLTFFS